MRPKKILRMSKLHHPVDGEKDYVNENFDNDYDIMDEKLLDAIFEI